MTGRFQVSIDQAQELRIGSTYQVTLTGTVTAVEGELIYLSQNESALGDKGVVEFEVSNVQIGEPV